MSKYGDDRYHQEMYNMYEEIRDFLKEHPISELFQIISDITTENISKLLKEDD